ncbi:Sensory transduction protein regX3 [bioreactor metagenome]|uniref:Sensory transduction protein regX3 n=1 Tax=bioreactor metagenome TaxID=1076179 RepID=A0A645GQU2_9ZZZZ
MIIVSAKSTELDTVTGLDLGADDYITKPFGVMELISRVKAMLRRTETKPESLLSLGAIVLDDEKRQVFAEGVLCQMTYKEHELLKYLLLNQEIVLTREKIMNKVWGTDFAGESRTVDMHIKTLRQKLGACGNMIKTVRNVGYKIEE